MLSKYEIWSNNPTIQANIAVMNNRIRTLLIFGIVLVVAFLVTTYLRKDEPRLQHITGQTMGTIIYNVKFIGQPGEVLKSEIDDELIAFNQSLSTYIPDSEISMLNKKGKLEYQSEYFYPVLSRSAEIFEKTDGAFDPTIGPLIQAWGFGTNKVIPDLDSSQVDSLRLISGFEKVIFDETGVSLPSDFNIDFSAVAKGFAVDVVGQLLEEKGIVNYLVEIGGEVRCRGVNDEDKSWSLGIEDPLVEREEQKLLAIVRLKDISLATSGNYRNYYQKDGYIYAHIIDPRTGFNAKHNLLSASVFTPDCMSADAYATAFMVLGLEESKRVMEREGIEGILIFQDADGSLKSHVSEGISPFVELNKAK